MSDKSLTIGEVCFMVSYADAGLKLPIIRTLVFVGKNIDDHEIGDSWYFQDVESFAEIGPYAGKDIPEDLEVEVHRLDKKGLGLIFDLDGLYEDLGQWRDR
jgi:hypothetical protein